MSLLSISGHHAPALFSALLDLFKNSKLQKAILIFLHIAVTNAPSFFLRISINNPLASTAFFYVSTASTAFFYVSTASTAFFYVLA